MSCGLGPESLSYFATACFVKIGVNASRSRLQAAEILRVHIIRNVRGNTLCIVPRVQENFVNLRAGCCSICVQRTLENRDMHFLPRKVSTACRGLGLPPMPDSFIRHLGGLHAPGQDI